MMNESITLQPKNLKTKKYRNGDPITLAQFRQDWIEAGEKGEGAYCISPSGGYLYNWYAVNDLRGLAPKGWKIPSDEEWSKVGNNDSLRIFDGLRNSHGSFNYQGSLAYFWSSTETSSDYAWYRLLTCVYSDLNRNFNDKREGFSVRCIKEKEI